jgi:phosphoglycolate phosphatase
MTGGPAQERPGGVDLVLWDLDGTITESGPGIMASYRHTLESLGRTADEAALRRCVGPPLAESLASLGVPPDGIAGAVATYRAYFAVHGIFDNRVYDGVPEVIDRLRSVGIRNGLATAKRHDLAVRILEHFDLAGLLDPVCGSTADGRITHKDEVIADALLTAGVPASSRVLMVGDREHDMFGATANGVVPIGVSWGYGDRRELEASGATRIVDTPAELLDLILAVHARA